MRVLDLFAGIGGFSLAAHWMGWETVGFVEWDQFNQRVLAKNFPRVPVHGDIREYKGQRHAADIICGGFPCQPFSTAGKRQGTDDSRYLWPEMLRVIREVQPAYVVGENVAGIYSMDDGRVFEQVCADLESENYSVQPLCIPACATGAPHRRDRWWFVAYANDVLQRRHADGGIVQRKTSEAKSQKQREERHELFGQRSGAGFGDGVKIEVAPNPSIEDDRRHTREPESGQESQPRNSIEQGVTTDSESRGCPILPPSNKWAPAGSEYPFSDAAILWGRSWIEVATLLCRMDDGLPSRLDSKDRKTIYNAVGYLGREETERRTGLDLRKVEDEVQRAERLKSLGNAIVPQVAYQIFQAIQESQ